MHKHDSEIVTLSIQLTEEWINRRSRKNVAYTIVFSAVKVPGK